MSTITDELRAAFQLYVGLGEDLTKIAETGDSKAPYALAECILQNRDCLARIEQMNSRISQLSMNRERARPNLDPESRAELDRLAAAVREQAVRLKELCSAHARKLQSLRDQAAKDLEEIGKTAQYLRSMKPVKNNYPKFVDSRY